jgi:hypothetical protein
MRRADLFKRTAPIASVISVVRRLATGCQVKRDCRVIRYSSPNMNCPNCRLTNPDSAKFQRELRHATL